MSKTAQPAPATDEKKSRGLGSYVVWAFVAVMVYFLSNGPVYLLVNRNFSDTRVSWFAGWLYMPWFLAYRDTPLHKPLGLYMHLWVPDDFDKNGELR